MHLVRACVVAGITAPATGCAALPVPSDDPKTSALQRLWIENLSVLPIEGLL